MPTLGVRSMFCLKLRKHISSIACWNGSREVWMSESIKTAWPVCSSWKTRPRPHPFGNSRPRPRRQYALINNCTLQKNEEGKVRLGVTNVVVRCLEITQNSVVLQQRGSREKIQLSLRDDERSEERRVGK